MASGLQAKNTLNLVGSQYSGGYVGEYTGATGSYQNWTDIPLSGSSTATYWYSDSDRADNANSIVVYVDIEEYWDAIVNYDNSIDITYQTYIKKIEKRYKYGNPGTTPRTIKISSRPGGAWIYQYPNTPMQLYVIARNLPIINGTIHLPPLSDSGGISTIYFKSGYPNHFDDPLPSIYVDAMGVGTSFRNTLPPTYIPGKTYANGSWWSHNRIGGAAKLYTSSGWSGNMKTLNGGVGQGDPPTIAHQNSQWYNMRRIGTE